MAFNPEEEVPPENIEMIGRPVQESSCVETRPWPSSDKQSHNHPGPADTMGINSKPVFAHDEEMTKTGIEEEDQAVCEMMEEAEGVEEGKMEEKAEEKVAEAELGVLCSFEGMPGSCLSPPENMEALPQEAEHQSPTFTAEHEPHLATSMTKREPTLTVEHEPHLATPMTKPEPTVTAEHGPHLATTMTKREPTLTAEHEPHLATPMAEHEHRPDSSTAEGHIKVTDRIAGQKKVFQKRQKAKPKMQTAEAAGTEGGPRNTRAPFRLQDFMCFKISKRYTVLFLLMLLASTVYSSETPKPVTGMCAVCQDHRCATNTSAIWKGNSGNLWKKEISNCSMDNLNSDVPCRMPNGWLVLLTDQHVLFEWRISPGARGVFTSVNKPCADLINSKPSPVADNKDVNGSVNGSVNGTVIGTVIGIGIGIGSVFIGTLIYIGFLIWNSNRCGQGQDGDHRHRYNGVPLHDVVHRDENTMEPLQGEVLNGNVNGEDDSVGTAG